MNEDGDDPEPWPLDMPATGHLYVLSSDSEEEVESLDSYDTQNSESEDDTRPAMIKGIYRKITTKIQYKTILQEDLDFFPEQLLINGHV
jgi:hypothetical protein